MDPVSGERRLSNHELLPVLVSFLLQSAWFPRNVEFSVFWQSVLSRLKGQQLETDWKEGRMATYLEQNLLQETPGGFSASWRSGIGVVPLGFSTFSSNAQERSWRTVKGLLKPGWLGKISLVVFLLRHANQSSFCFGKRSCADPLARAFVF
jgi:hypothetical protein